MSLFLRHMHKHIGIMASSSRHMSSCYVRCVSGEERVQIQFEFQRDNGHSRVFNSERRQSEPVARSLERIAQNVSNFVNKTVKKRPKTKNAEAPAPIEVKIQLLRKGEMVADDIPVSNALTQGSILRIQGSDLFVEVNAPTVNSIRISDSLLAGFPLFPLMDVEFTDLHACEFTWSKIKYKEIHCEEELKQGKKESVQRVIVETTEVAKTFSYTPSNFDIGYYLKLCCIPKSGNRAGKPFEIESKYEVSAGPGLCPFENRHVYTQTPTEAGVFRVISYNILADLYADSDFTRTELFPYCPPYALALDYRKHLLLKELQGYNSDIVCLQEVDGKFFRSDLMTAMDSLGFSGALLEKGIDVKSGEGSAIFYRNSKFKQVGDHSMLIKDILEEEDVCSDILEKSYSKPSLKEKLETRGSILHVLGLESVESSGKLVLLANTHFYFHPDAGNIRLIHAITCIRYLEKLLKQYEEQGYSASLVFCGDFNSVSHLGVFKFVTTKSVTEKETDWQSGGSEMFVEGMNFSHSLNLQSGCGVIPYTNYTEGFHGMLDYIFYDLDTLEVNQIVPPPDHQEVTQHSALPSVVFPSDHIAQICDFAWKF